MILYSSFQFYKSPYKDSFDLHHDLSIYPMLSDKENKIKVSLWKKNHDKACSIKPPQSMFEKQFSDAEFLIIQKKKKKGN